jgi:DNA-binding beta-propeller fold protein YncE
VVVTGDGKWTFVSQGNSIAVLSNGAGLAPSLVRTIPVAGPAQGEALTPDGRYLLAASGSGAVVINVAAAEQGGPNPVTGTLSAPNGKGAVGVAVSHDSRVAFVTLQFSNTLAVFNLQAALSRGFGPSDLIGTVPLGVHPVGMNIGRDGRWLYVVSQQRSNTSQQGLLTVINVQKAAVKPASSIVAQAPAGCHPVRVVTAGHGADVWVTVRESNTLLGFSASKLRSDPAHALIARVQVGQSPIGLAPVDGGARIVVANSNLAGRKGIAPSLAVVNTSAALAGKPALVGLIKTGLLPRQFALRPDGRSLLVTNSTSRQLEAVDVSHLP